jgi:alkylhydroperoxidase family enzyme
VFRNPQRSASVRVEPLTAPYANDVHDVLTSMMPAGVAPIGLFRTFAKNLPMTSAMRGWGRYELSRESSLTVRDREIVIDRTCARCGCEYEWGVHIAYFADRAELTEAQIVSVTHGTSADECWTDEHDRTVIETVDALHDHASIPDELWDRLVTELAEPQIIDLVVLCGWYHAIAYAANALGVAAEDWAPSFADFARDPTFES